MEKMEEKTNELDALGNAENKTVKNFRQTPEIENFYRFVHENGLRREARIILETVYKAITGKKKVR